MIILDDVLDSYFRDRGDYHDTLLNINKPAPTLMYWMLARWEKDAREGSRWLVANSPGVGTQICTGSPVLIGALFAAKLAGSHVYLFYWANAVIGYVS